MAFIVHLTLRPTWVQSGLCSVAAALSGLLVSPLKGTGQFQRPGPLARQLADRQVGQENSQPAGFHRLPLQRPVTDEHHLPTTNTPTRFTETKNFFDCHRTRHSSEFWQPNVVAWLCSCPQFQFIKYMSSIVLLKCASVLSFSESPTYLRPSLCDLRFSKSHRTATGPLK